MHYYHSNGGARSKPKVRREPLAIHTGLSVTVAGYLIALERDEFNLVAKIVIKPYDDSVAGKMELDAVSVAAKLLAQRARRVLGNRWTVVEYKGVK